MLKDCNGVTIEHGQDVVFNYSNYNTRLKRGRVCRISKANVWIRCDVWNNGTFQDNQKKPKNIMVIV